jgi:hypothetical protein
MMDDLTPLDLTRPLMQGGAGFCSVVLPVLRWLCLSAP